MGMTEDKGRKQMKDQKHRNREKRIWRNRRNRDAADREIDRLLEQFERSNELVRRDLHEV